MDEVKILKELDHVSSSGVFIKPHDWSGMTTQPNRCPCVLLYGGRIPIDHICHTLQLADVGDMYATGIALRRST